MPNWVQYWCRKVWTFLGPNQINLLYSLLSKLCTILQKPWRSLVGSSWMLHPTSQTTEKDATCQARTWPNCTLRKREQINSLNTKRSKKIWSSSRLPAESNLTGEGLKAWVWSVTALPQPASRGEAPVLRVPLLLLGLPALPSVRHDQSGASPSLTDIHL